MKISNVTIAADQSDGKSLLQKNSEIESFYQKLIKLHKSSGLNLVFDLRQTTLDLHLFYKEVTVRGGFIQVTADGRWGEVALALNLDGDYLQDPQPLLKLYAVVLYQYEQLYYYREPHVKAASTLGHAFYNIGDSLAMEGSCRDSSSQIPNLEEALVEKKMPKKNCQPTLIGSTSTEQKHLPQLHSKNREMKKRCGAPRGGKSAYHVFLKQECERLKSTSSEKGQRVRYMADQAWRSLSMTEKQPYIEASKKLNEKRFIVDEENQDIQSAEMTCKSCVENQASIDLPEDLMYKRD